MNPTCRCRVAALLIGLLTVALPGCGAENAFDASGRQGSSDSGLSSRALQPRQVKPVPITGNKGAASLANFKQGVLLATLQGGDTKTRKLRYAASLGDGTEAEANFEDSAAPERSVEAVRRSPQSRARAVFDDWLERRSRNDLPVERSADAPLRAQVAHQVGEHQAFWVSEQTGKGKDDFRKVQQPARLIAITAHAYFYVDERYLGANGRFAQQAALDQVIRYFEEVAVPVDTRYFGTYPAPPSDIDNDARLTVLFTKMYDGVVGYFDPENATREAESNQRDMLYAGVEPFQENSGFNTVKATLIHELVHMIVHNHKVWGPEKRGQKALDENKFLDEGMAVVAEQLGGLALPGGEEVSVDYVREFLADNPSAPLIDERDDYLYGTGYLFVLYLMEQHGQDVLRKLTQSNTTGIRNVEQATGRHFGEVFRDWSVALFATDYSADPRYNFKTVKLHATYGNKHLNGLKVTQAANLPVREDVKARPWSIIPIGFKATRPGATLRVEVVGAKGEGLEATLLDTSTLRD